MKRKLIARNKKKYSVFMKDKYWNILKRYLKSDTQNSRGKRKYIQFKDYENAYRFGRFLLVPILTSSPVARSRIKNRHYSSLCVTLDEYNERFGTNKVLEDFGESPWKKK